MIILTESRILDTQQVKYIKLCMQGTCTEKPCISFVLEYGAYIDRAFEIDFPDFETAQTAFKSMQEAIINEVSVLDMRR